MGNEEIILDLLKSVKSEVVTQGKSVARLEASDGYRLSVLEEIQSQIKEIRETDAYQTLQIQSISDKVHDLYGKHKQTTEEIAKYVLSPSQKDSISEALTTLLSDKAKLNKEKRKEYVDALVKSLPYIFGAGGVVTVLLEVLGIIKILH